MQIRDKDKLSKAAMVISAAGAVLGIVSVFIYWFEADFVVFSFDYTGYDFFMKTHEYPDTGGFIYMPLAVLIFSVAAAVSVLLMTMKKKKAAGIAGLASGVIVLAASLVYVFYPETKMHLSTGPDTTQWVDWIHEIKIMDYLGPGAYTAVMSGALIIIGSVIFLYCGKRFEDAQEQDQQKSNIS